MSATSPRLWVGIGCVRGTSQQIIEMAIAQAFRDNQLDMNAIAGFATIDTKRNEIGLVQFCQSRNLPLKFFSADVLRTVSVPNPNQVVGESVGTPSVAEAAALCAVLDLPHAKARQCVAGVSPVEAPAAQSRKEKEANESFASWRLGVRHFLLVPKQVFRFSAKGMVTVAVAHNGYVVALQR